jgi:malate synthase
MSRLCAALYPEASMTAQAATMLQDIEIRGAITPPYDKILTPEAIDFVATLERKFGNDRQRILAKRAIAQAKLDAGWRPNFPADTKTIRESDWAVAPLPKDLLDRRVEITGPTDRKMVINALNSGAGAAGARLRTLFLPAQALKLAGS